MNISKQKQNQVVTMIKNRAFNRMREVYSKRFVYDNFPGDGSYAEQRDYAIARILEDMENDIKKYKAKIKRYLQSFQ